MADRGVIVDFDFAVANGAEVLFNTTKKFLKELDGIAFDVPLEARFLASNGYQDGLNRLFALVKTKKTAQKAARELAAAFAVELTKVAPAAVGVAFRNFVKALVERGVRIVIATRADIEVLRPAFDFVNGDRVTFYQEASDCFGTCRWDSWVRACRGAKLGRLTALALAGSGHGVKSALVAGMGAVGVVNDHVAYQDYGGADCVVPELSGKTAKEILKALRVKFK